MHHHSPGSFSGSHGSPSSETIPPLPQPICNWGGTWSRAEGTQSRGIPGQMQTSGILDLSAEKSV